MPLAAVVSVHHCKADALLRCHQLERSDRYGTASAQPAAPPTSINTTKSISAITTAREQQQQQQQER
jgi:hypothetical protein